MNEGKASMGNHGFGRSGIGGGIWGTTLRASAAALVVAGVGAVAIAFPARSAHACAVDSDCDDGLACNGEETCDTGSGTCHPGQAVDCSHLAGQCKDAACVEPAGTCSVTNKIDGFRCDDGYHCTTADICVDGECEGAGGADTDGDGYCDVEETQGGCDPSDAAQVPMQENIYSGGRSANGGEILLTFRTPVNRTVLLPTDTSCSRSGRCNVATAFCESGRIGDPCAADSECDQEERTCRILVNYTLNPDVSLTQALLKIPRQKAIDVSGSFRVAPGCSQKVDLVLPPGFGKARLLLKAIGTLSGRLKKDTDRVLFVE